MLGSRRIKQQTSFAYPTEYPRKAKNVSFVVRVPSKSKAYTEYVFSITAFP